MKRQAAVWACWLAVGWAGATGLAAADAEFATPVKASREGDAFRIDFASRTATDCAVEILNRDGRVVRHLAAGLLGEKAPLPLAKGSLQQSLVWDGRDDWGQPAADGPFQVRVSLRSRPVLQQYLADNPAALGSVRALATGPRGELFVWHVFGELHPNDGTPTCAVFDRQGKYLRTILPFPAGLADERWQGLKRLRRDDGEQVPFLYQAETRSLLPGAGDLPPHRAVATRDGRLAFVGIREGPKRYAQAGASQVLVLRADGGAPAGGPFGPGLAELTSSGASLALSPDQRTLYAAGLRQGSLTGQPLHAVFRSGWADAATAPFVGVPGESGGGQDRLNTPRSVAVDGQGRIYVADRGNNRVAVFSPQGAYVGDLSVELPERVETHPETGALYVLAGERIDRLLKFAAWDRPQPVAETRLPSFKHPYYTALLALDASAEPPVLWAASPQGRYARFDLLRIEDLGAKFGEPADVGAANAKLQVAAGPVLDLELDRDRGRLYVNSLLYDLARREWAPGLREAGGKSTGNAGMGSVGLDGNFYSQIFPNIVRRIGPDLQPLRFDGPGASSKGDLLSPLKKGDMRVRGRGITADRRGNMYILWEDQENFGRDEAFNHLYLHAADGAVTKERLITGGIRSLNSVRIDPRGNVYLALGLRPGKELLPGWLAGQAPASPKSDDAVGGLNTYPLIYGSIAKFGPAGGEVRPGCGGVPCNYAFGAPVEVKGAEWIFSGASPVVSWRTPGTPDICNCESPRFDVDEFGRSFFPDAAGCRVGMLDTAGNLLGWFGSYDNADARGQASSPSNADRIGLLWPYCVAVGDQGVFVGDRLNRRVAWIRLTYAAAETRPLP